MNVKMFFHSDDNENLMCSDTESLDNCLVTEHFNMISMSAPEFWFVFKLVSSKSNITVEGA